MAAVVEAVAVPLINEHFQEQNAQRTQDEATQLMSSALARSNPRIEKLLAAKQQEIIQAQASGRKVYVVLTTEGVWQDTTDPETGLNLVGDVMMNANVVDIRLKFEDEPFKKYDPDNSAVGDFFRFLLGTQLVYDSTEVEIEGTDETMRKQRLDRKAIESMWSPKEPFEKVILQAWQSGPSVDAVRQYAAQNREACYANAPPLAEYWGRMERLAEMPLEEVVPHARKAGVPLDALRKYAEKEIVDAGLDSHGAVKSEYWRRVIAAIDAQ